MGAADPAIGYNHPVAERKEIESHIYELEELALQPGTYFNPQTEVVVIVDDSASLDQEIFNLEDYEGADWVRISDEVPVDESSLEETLEFFQTHYHPDVSGAVSEALEAEGGELDADEPEPDPEREA